MYFGGCLGSSERAIKPVVNSFHRIGITTRSNFSAYPIWYISHRRWLIPFVNSQDIAAVLDSNPEQTGKTYGLVVTSCISLRYCSRSANDNWIGMNPPWSVLRKQYARKPVLDFSIIMLGVLPQHLIFRFCPNFSASAWETQKGLELWDTMCYPSCSNCIQSVNVVRCWELHNHDAAGPR